MTQGPVDDLISLLDLEPIEQNIFRGQSPDEQRQRVFGGQVAGQALVAATRTVEYGAVHSLHAYFLRPGDPTIPILYEVERIRDGRSFATRRVVAIQHGQAIFICRPRSTPPRKGSSIRSRRRRACRIPSRFPISRPETPTRPSCSATGTAVLARSIPAMSARTV
ncbi:MAG: thioesterase family protein [Acidimicrobiales bacterium]